MARKPLGFADGAGSDEALVGALDTTEAWTIKAFSRTLRLAVVNAARLEGVTTGQWLERCVRDRLDVDGTMAQRALPAPGAAPTPPLDLAGLAQLLSALGTMPEGGLRRDAERTTRALLRQARGLSPVRGRALPQPQSLRDSAT